MAVFTFLLSSKKYMWSTLLLSFANKRVGKYRNLYLTFYQEYLSSNYSNPGFSRSGIFFPMDRSMWWEFQLIKFLLKKKKKNQHSQVVLVLRISGFCRWRRSGSSQGLGPRIFFQSSKAESFIFYRATNIRG